MLPQSTRTIALSVKGGDTVSVAITEQSAGMWLIELKDVTTGRASVWRYICYRVLRRRERRSGLTPAPKP